MKEFFKELFEYTFHFNEIVVNSLQKIDGTIPEKAVQLINHTINAQEIWNARINEKPYRIDVWGIRPLDTLKEINEINYQNSLKIIDTFDFENKVTYTNTQGKAFSNTVRDMLFHTVNHSTYHRGQIATYCKLENIIPEVTDYIFYKRQQL
ncbi:DinB family protein [Flavobacterium cerinum]|uniref:Damage-inducible protein DinB n=1 Tax=Flavobacterium cerinum TaxID=2502784 RepID=A0A444HAY5_9FLAO|nr:DinB family protein [Flavobacterium cerinum]RWX00395.1 damage-inducible protein DinB [Flavobacterium cerinum]